MSDLGSRVNLDLWNLSTLKDFKNTKKRNSKYLLIFNVSILLRFGKTEHQYVSKIFFLILCQNNK